MESGSEKKEAGEGKEEPPSEPSDEKVDDGVDLRLHNRLLELKEEITPTAEKDPAIPKDTPFIRMLYSIPVFALFWLAYWLIFLKK